MIKKTWGNESDKIRNVSVCLPEVRYPRTLGHNFVLLWQWLLPLPSRECLTVVLVLLSVSWCLWKEYIHRYTVPGKVVLPDRVCYWNTGQGAGTKMYEYIISSLHTPTHGKERETWKYHSPRQIHKDRKLLLSIQEFIFLKTWIDEVTTKNISEINSSSVSSTNGQHVCILWRIMYNIPDLLSFLIWTLELNCCMAPNHSGIDSTCPLAGSAG